MKCPALRSTVLACWILVGTTGRANDASEELSQVIDQHVEARLASESVTPTEQIDDYTFARRITLDLAGRVPTQQELQTFIPSTSSDKRRAYVDRLLDSPDFAYHLRNSLDALLLAPQTKDDAWREYLLESTRENKSWDQLFREILLPEEECPDDKRPATYLRTRANDVDTMTNDTSSLWFGVNISCAKCHDHPLVSDWEQQHYFGLASFFQRTFSTRTGFVSERFDGRMKFTTVSGDEHQANFMFLTGVSVSEPDLALEKQQRDEINQKIRAAEREDGAPLPPRPDFSPRAELVRLALSFDGTDFFARNIVNRIWAQLIGHGLVHPLDQMHSENPPSHPEVLDALARDFVHHGYDLKRLFRSIVLTRTYARSSRWTEEALPPSPDLFARGQVRPLTPWQLSLSLRVASRVDIQGLSNSNWESRRQQLENQSLGFASHLPIPSEAFQVGTDEALLFSNSEEFHREFLGDNSGQLVQALREVADDEVLIERAFLNTVSRQPSEAERGALGLHLAQRAGQREDAVRQLVWTLLASPEFRFNY